jgi:hypothetical protein
MGCDPVDVVAIAKRAGVSKVTAAGWAGGTIRATVGPPFPAERGRFGTVRWWNWPDVEAWIEATTPAWDRTGRKG